MPGLSFTRRAILAALLGLGMIGASFAAESPRNVARHQRAREYVRDQASGEAARRAQAMRYAHMAVMRAKCEMARKDPRQCARYTISAPAAKGRQAAPSAAAPAALPPAAASPHPAPPVH